MNKETVLFEILKALNMGNSGYVGERISLAKEQTEKLMKSVDISKIHVDENEGEIL